MKAEFRTMRCIAGLLLLTAIFTVHAFAQLDAPPARIGGPGPLIPSPPCLTLRGIWLGGSAACTPFTHRDWLAEITHWRTERRIYIGYDPSRYTLPQLQWGQ